ncbi:hypothetical protein D9757_012813 [Collybiopsis confluens]|uniref:Uncharacterized protein n=1 Tax=Collybiopsis confluens TaxID=2823264 RepID=A0A8H5D9C7_9AGAR|nr:hypothetical protein D9757_012813 [Collybiopsis confluens]
MSPVPSASTTHSASNEHIIYHTTGSISSIWTIIALTVILVAVCGVLCYSLYRCYRSALYQHDLEYTERLYKQTQASNSSLEKDSEGKAYWEKGRNSADYDGPNHSVISFESSSTMPDLTSPPLAVTYASQSPRILHASPILALPSDFEYEHVQLSNTSRYLDSKSASFYVLNVHARSHDAMSKSTIISNMSPILAAQNSATTSTEQGFTTAQDLAPKVSAICPRPRSMTLTLRRSRAPSLAGHRQDPFAHACSSDCTRLPLMDLHPGVESNPPIESCLRSQL